MWRKKKDWARECMYGGGCKAKRDLEVVENYMKE